jgi:hypothetical protein
MRKNGLWGLLLGLFHCQLIQAQATTSSSGAAAVPVSQEHHHRVVLQNAYIRVLDGLVALHDTTPMHIHAANSVVVFLSHSTFGIQVAGEAAVITDVSPGDMRYSPYGDKPVTHIVWDQGPEDFHFYVVELASAVSGHDSQPALVSDRDSCPAPIQPGLTYQWRKGAVTAYYWDIPTDWHCSLPAGDCAFLLIDLSRQKAGGDHPFQFFPPRHAPTISGHRHEDAQYILLQLRPQ